MSCLAKVVEFFLFNKRSEQDKSPKTDSPLRMILPLNSQVASGIGLLVSVVES